MWAFFPNLQPGEMIVIGLFAVLLFGKRLPEVGRALGKGIVEFKKGLNGEEDEPAGAGPGSTGGTTLARNGSSAGTTPSTSVDVPRFEPPSAPPSYETPYEPQSYRD